MAEDARHLLAQKLFAKSCEFVYGAAPGADFPPTTVPEVAFAGRSNVGKSSLLNALTSRRNLARTSNTPGRTRELNFFSLDERIMLVDLPGYGYAKASKKDIAAWTETMHDYLAGRPTLARLFVLIDGRHGVKPIDEEMMDLLDPMGIVYQLVLTKCDKVGGQALASLVAATQATLAGHAAAFPAVLATSARARTGLDALRAEIAKLAAAKANR
ncbi:MAG: ribosome biogenesis GTP-binding protein YihA/YsxC [Alphaproteobacteria bacterium]|nr:ribosome biogenesis GTP-binding protein YihA/YsxC [Alphaproteobacteria bacterium]